MRFSPSWVFVILVSSLLASLVLLGSLTVMEESVSGNASIRGFAYSEKFSMESYRPITLTVSFPPSSVNQTVVVTSISLLGAKTMEQQAVASHEQKMTFLPGRYDIGLSFFIANETTPNAGFPHLLDTDLGLPVSSAWWIFSAISTAILASLIMVAHGATIDVLVGPRDGKELVHLAQSIDAEIVAKNLNLDIIQSSYVYYKGPATSQLNTFNDVDTYFQGLSDREKRARETRPALLSIALVNLAVKFREICQRVNPSWLFFLTQAAERAIIKTAYTQETGRLIDRIVGRGDLPDVAKVKQSMDSAVSELQKANSQLTTSKVVYSSFAAIAITLVLPLAPSNWIIVKIALTTYVITNFLMFLFAWFRRKPQT